MTFSSNSFYISKPFLQVSIIQKSRIKHYQLKTRRNEYLYFIRLYIRCIFLVYSTWLPSGRPEFESPACISVSLNQVQIKNSVITRLRNQQHQIQRGLTSGRSVKICRKSYSTRIRNDYKPCLTHLMGRVRVGKIVYYDRLFYRPLPE